MLLNYTLHHIIPTAQQRTSVLENGWMNISKPKNGQIKHFTFLNVRLLA